MNDEVKDLAEATNVLLENQEEMEWQQRKLKEVVHMLQGIWTGYTRKILY